MKEKFKKIYVVFIVIFLVGSSLGACATQTPTQAPEQAEPTTPPEVAQPTAVEVQPTAVEAQPTAVPTEPEPVEADVCPARGGQVVIGMIQEPGQLSEFFNNQSGSAISFPVVEPLFEADESGIYKPILASEIPTVENGGISADSKTVIYKIRQDILWSDGEPFTAEDIIFTWEVYKNPESTPVGTAIVSTYESIDSVELLDQYTVQVNFSEIAPGYLELWMAVLPKHKFESTAITFENELARIPLGTGPFIITEWKTGDQIVMEKNPNYREAGKPCLDKIIVKMTPDKEAAVASFLAGDLDTIFFFAAGDLPDVQAAIDAGSPLEMYINPNPSWVEWLWLNHLVEGDLNTPNPVLGDLAVREAIDYAIDRQAIIDDVLEGYGYLEGSFLYSGWARVNIPATAYDPDKANQILDEAGWVMGDDGYRVKDGVVASVEYTCIAGDHTRELYQQLVQQNLKDVGIKAEINNMPSASIFGAYDEGGILRHGQFDMVMSRAGYVIEPSTWAASFRCDQIVSEANKSGSNYYTFYCNPQFDELTTDATSTLDQSTRSEYYDQAAELFYKDRVALPLYASFWGWAWQDRLNNVDAAWWGGMWVAPSVANWYIDESN